MQGFFVKLVAVVSLAAASLFVQAPEVTNFVGAAPAAAAEDCDPKCPEPGKASGKWKSVEAKKRFEAECTWLKFPVGKVKKPIVFFTRESDSRCIGKQYRRACPDCTEWIQPHRPRGPVNGPAAKAVIAVRLHNGLSGVSVPRDAYSRIKEDGAWCDYGRTDPHDSHGYNERPW